MREDTLKPPENDETVRSWLEGQMNAGHSWLLAHADDGVIWGKLVASKLVTSHEADIPRAKELSPSLRGITLQQAFVFGAQGEVRLWREGSTWRCRHWTSVDEAHLPKPIEEDQILWGTHDVARDTRNGFTHVEEKRQQGMEHIVPLLVTRQDLDARRLRLQVRHCIERDSHTGVARIFFSRLVDLRIV